MISVRSKAMAITEIHGRLQCARVIVLAICNRSISKSHIAKGDIMTQMECESTRKLPSRLTIS
jgi:hypothetical protein